jgi:peroxiredoxin
MKRIGIIAIIAGIAMLAVSAFYYLSIPHSGDPAPSFVASDLNGADVSLEALRGKPVILNFFATWCGYCRDEMPSLVNLYERKKDAGLFVLAVSEDESPAGPVKAFMQGFGADFSVVMDEGGSIADKYGAFGLPVSVLIDRDGVIRGRFDGSVDWGSEDMERRIDELIGK